MEVGDEGGEEIGEEDVGNTEGKWEVEKGDDMNSFCKI